MNSLEESLKPFPVWEDLVLDFLEMACFLQKEEQRFLVDELERLGVQAENIDVHPCFSIRGRIIVICENEAPKECWIYRVKQKSIQRWRQFFSNKIRN